MQNIRNISEWLKLSDADKEKEYSQWNVYEGEGQNILSSVICELKTRYANDANFLDVKTGLLHGGLWTIEVSLKKGSKNPLSKTYCGFPVVISRSQKNGASPMPLT